MKHISKYILAVVILISPLQLQAQKSEDQIWKALNDELSRNMNHLSYLDYQRPFFIGYTLGSNNYGVILGSLGSIVLSNENKLNAEMIRVMVGNQKLCDENFENENDNVRYNGGNIPLPMDEDYYGIRRTLWIQTDKVYKAAGETYKNKLYILKRNNIPVDSLIPDFSPTPVSKLKVEGPGYKFERTKWEDRVRVISAYFKKYPYIDDSGVSFRFAKANTYMVNSEGSEVKSPVDVAVITIVASTTASDGMRLSDNIEVVAPVPDELPANEWFSQEIDKLAQRLKSLRTAETLSENYTGPVLFVDQAASEVISSSLFSQEDPLIAIREPLYADRNMKIFTGNNPGSLENKQNKKVIASDLTVKALPHMDKLGNTSLIGHYEIDADGVVPPQEVTLVENGLLKTLLCDRTPTKMVPQSNGHRRYAFFTNGISYITGPSVIDVSGKKQSSLDDLKKQLIEKAKEEGLDFAILVKRVDKSMADFPIEIYKVSLTDGKETLIRPLTINSLSLGTLKKCIGISNQKVAYNTLLNVGPSPQGGSFTPDISGLPASFITPNGILIEEMDLKALPKNLSEEKPVVPSPLEAGM